MHVLRYGAESRKPSQCIKLVNACIKIWSQCVKVGNACIKISNGSFLAPWDTFWHCETFFEKILKIHGRPARADIITPADN